MNQDVLNATRYLVLYYQNRQTIDPWDGADVHSRLEDLYPEVQRLAAGDFYPETSDKYIVWANQFVKEVSTS